jgi:hypothetical protein
LSALKNGKMTASGSIGSNRTEKSNAFLDIKSY